ncbi:MAG: lipopolysaccharide biosynthesis protein [Spirochaetaceae bacterium]|nr:lipopolysaccharide biosynthesis protein [Spirochaetaceae bacterium]
MDQSEIKQEFQGNDDEISLIDLIAVLWRYKVMIITITAVAIVTIVIVSIVSLVLPPEKSFLPNEYTASAQMLINDPASSSSGLASQLSASGLGGLASMVGVDLGGGGSSYSSLATYLVYSNSILDMVVAEFNLIEKFEIEESPKTNSREALKELLTCVFDEETGVFTLSFTDIDPVFAQEVVNFVVRILEQRFLDMGLDKNQLSKINLEQNIDTSYKEIIRLHEQIQQLEFSVSNVYSSAGTPSIMRDTALLKTELAVQENVYGQLKAQYEMLKVTMASEQPVFQILEYAEVPDRKSGPSRGMLCVIVTFAAGFFSVFLAFLLNAIKNVKNDPVAMKKLSSGKKKRG